MLMRILNFAVDYDLLDKNRLKVITIEKGIRRERVISEDEYSALQVAASLQLWRLMLLVLNTGLRESVLLSVALNWIRAYEDGWWLSLPKARTTFKAHAPRIPLNAAALAALVP